MGERPGGIEAGNARNCRVRTDVEENLVAREHACAAVIEAHLERLRRHKAPGPHDQLAAGCLVEMYMQRNLALDHIALTLADPCHVGRDSTADHRAELGGVTCQMRDPRAPNLVLAREAGDIGTRAPDPAALDDGRPSPRSRHMPSYLLAALATAKDQNFEPLCFRHELPPCTPQSVCDLEHDLAGLVRRAILISFWIYQWQRDLHLSLSKPGSFLQRVEVGDDILPIGVAGEIDEHPGPVNEAGRVCEVFVEIGVIPGDVRILHRRGEIVPWNRGALATDNAGERWPDLVFTGLRRVAGNAMGREHGLASRGITAASAVGELPSTAIRTKPAL